MGKLIQHLAAKTGDRNGEWLPLRLHLSDTAAVSDYLITHYLSDSVQAQTDIPPDQLRKTIVFLAFVHDIGKATALFQTESPSSFRCAGNA